MKFALLTIGDGRDELLNDTLRSFYQCSWIDPTNREASGLVEHVHVDDRLHVLGFCGAIRYGWDRLRESKQDFSYVFHLEEDWRFEHEFDIAHMARLLGLHADLAQVALRRPPEGEVERLGGGVVGMFPEEFEERIVGFLGGGQPARTQAYLRHRLFFTTNPCLYRRSLIDAYQWPEPPGCEAAFTETLVADGASFAYWGDRDDEPWITHTGQRTGHSY